MSRLLRTGLIYGLLLVVVSVLLLHVLTLVYVIGRNPPATPIPWDSPETERLARRACMDCHSNETDWPWYSYVPPVSLLVVRDVVAGRSELNFSEPQGLSSHDLREAVETIVEGEMPPPLYTWLRPEARLTPEERDRLVEGLQRTFGAR